MTRALVTWGAGFTGSNLVDALLERGAELVETAPAREGEMKRTASDPSHAEADLNWRAATGVDEGLRIALDAA